MRRLYRLRNGRDHRITRLTSAKNLSFTKLTMTRGHKVLLGITCAVGLALLAPFLFVCWFLYGMFEGVTTRYDAPTDPKAIKGGFYEGHRPSSLRNVCQWWHAEGLQIFEKFVRFEVDREQIPDALKMVAEPYGARSIDAYIKGSIDPGKFMPAKTMTGDKLPWWQLGSIKHGSSYSCSRPYRMIWVDEDRGVIYMHTTD